MSETNNDKVVSEGTEPVPATQRDVSDVLAERLIDAEYKIWKKNTPYLYDFVMTHSLEWPSLTCQWLPTIKSGDKSEEHNMLIGTHTTGEQNYLMVANVNLPKGDTVIDNRMANDDNNDPAVTASANYDDEKNELGGFGGGSNSGKTIGKIEIRMKIKHEGEVNRARYMPQNHFIVASRGHNPQVYIWDLSKHPSFPTEGTVPTPQAVCLGHSREGYGMCWSQHKEGHLISGSEDSSVCLWDIRSSVLDNKNNKESTNGTQIKALSTFNGHTDVVEDVDWHHRDVNLFGSVGDDRSIRIWDVREKNPTNSVHVVENAHEGDINSIAFNPVNEFILATGSADKSVALWDMRNLKSRLQTFAGHTDQVFHVEWAPFNESILASCSSDRRVAIWDLSRIGMEQTAEDAEDGPPELLFLHGGHTSKVSDLSWNPNDEWTVASVSEDNVLQVWNMAEEIYAGEDEPVIGSDDDHAALNDDELE
eukprot:CAMPEP_0197836884 /NCGR_PEP_ID=MMETSP1437-20131217/30384_1 /TAXON_ID=49252 ORGANISM="Eucampia antarctica, Strain CCMP1452" /NCGR_SAMPLE_ID=MMETSP1437 /ASSEMBLY_ACC=CAM_ASM_001096 /LENGTH=477 /DNA_ID=CAMNT_0043443435 /DNA_START=16 /DNA_END=1449 /DNA_ORIENTATION=-